MKIAARSSLPESRIISLNGAFRTVTTTLFLPTTTVSETLSRKWLARLVKGSHEASTLKGITFNCFHCFLTSLRPWKACKKCKIFIVLAFPIGLCPWIFAESLRIYSACYKRGGSTYAPLTNFGRYDSEGHSVIKLLLVLWAMHHFAQYNSPHRLTNRPIRPLCANFC